MVSISRHYAIEGAAVAQGNIASNYEIKVAIIDNEIVRLEVEWYCQQHEGSCYDKEESEPIEGRVVVHGAFSLQLDAADELVRRYERRRQVDVV
jgi:hypothetical protein